MANPQPTDAHGIIAHEIQENLLIRGFTEKLLKLIYLIIRLSWGCNCKGWQYKSYKDFEVIGIYKGNVAGHLNYLRENKVIYWNEKYKFIAFNKNYDEWKIAITKNSGSERIKSLVSDSLKNCNEVRNILTVLDIFKNDVREIPERQNSDKPIVEPICVHPKESIKERFIYTADFEKFYTEYPRPEDKRRSFNNWKTCLKEYSVDDLMKACNNYRIAKKGTEKKYLKTSANFLGRDKPFEDYIKYIPSLNNVACIPKSDFTVDELAFIEGMKG